MIYPKVTVIGAGFSGLVTAYYLKRKGFDVDIVEKSARVGGLISTVESDYGIIETAANGLLNSPRVEDLFKDLDIVMYPARKISRRRYIFRRWPRRWPVSLFQTSRLFFTLFYYFIFGFKSRLRPKPGETISHWAETHFGRWFLTYLLGPVLQGIYAGDPSRLSASLILSRFFEKNIKKSRKLKMIGTVAPRNGMGQLITALKDWLTEHGVTIHTETEVVWNPQIPNWKWVIATNASDAAHILGPTCKIHQQLQNIEISPVVSVTAFFHPLDARTKGFGILFPRNQGVRALGVLMNNEIFDNRSDYRSETWIYGGALDHEVCDLSDAELISQLMKDRKIVERGISKPLSYRIQRWPRAIPHYTINLEKILKNLPELENTYLVGNYLGRLGLSRILDQAYELSENMEQESKIETTSLPRKAFDVTQERRLTH